jgi:hypothetical protein
MLAWLNIPSPHPTPNTPNLDSQGACSQLLIFQLSFQLLRLGHLADRFVEIILAHGVAVVLDGEQATVRRRSV